MEGKKLVLLAEDEELVRNLYTNMLQTKGFEVVACVNGLEALNKYNESPSKFDLVITDYKMPKLTGSALAQHIKITRPDLPIIVCTGYSSHFTEDEAKKAGIEIYVEKPVKMVDFFRYVQKALDRAEEHRKLNDLPKPIDLK